jgi:hypothetical protein
MLGVGSLLKYMNWRFNVGLRESVKITHFPKRSFKLAILDFPYSRLHGRLLYVPLLIELGSRTQILIHPGDNLNSWYLYAKKTHMQRTECLRVHELHSQLVRIQTKAKL